MKFPETEGDPTDLSVCGSYMAVGTTKAVLKVYDLSRRYWLSSLLYFLYVSILLSSNEQLYNKIQILPRFKFLEIDCI